MPAPKGSLSSDRVLQPACVKVKPLVIVHQRVTVKHNQALHTPPITLGECAKRGLGVGACAAARRDRLVGDLSEVDTR